MRAVRFIRSSQPRSIRPCPASHVGDWTPDATLNAHHRELSLFIIPAWIEGTWKCVVNQPGNRGHMTLHLHRRYQRVRGTAHVGRFEVPLTYPTLVGDRFAFTVFHPRHAKPATRYTCRVENNTMRGTCHAVGDAEAGAAWAGSRSPRT